MPTPNHATLRLALLITCLLGCRDTRSRPSASPPASRPVPLAADVAEDLDRLVEDAIRRGDVPGAVVVVGRRDGVVYEKAYGNRAVAPSLEPMTLDTVFDLASLTK